MKRTILALIILFSISFVHAQQKTLTDTTVYVAADQEASFPGGMENFYKYVSQNIHYPATARVQSLQGRIIIYTVIEKDGSLSNIKVLRGLSPDLNQEALRVVAESPKWIAAINKGQPVRSSFTFPIIIHISALETPASKADSASNSFKPVDVEPSFPGGMVNFYNLINKYLRYPKEDEQNDVRGRVMVSFVVEKDGSMTDFKIVKSLSETADAEALRVLKMIEQKWNPGIQNGHPVRVQYTIPVMFPMSK